MAWSLKVRCSPRLPGAFGARLNHSSKRSSPSQKVSDPRSVNAALYSPQWLMRRSWYCTPLLMSHPQRAAGAMMIRAIAKVSQYPFGRCQVSEAFWRQRLVNGPIDADKFDYLRRDALHAGVPYSQSIDVERFLGGLTVVRDDDKSLSLAVKQKAISSAEMFSMARYFMYTSVYYQHTVRMFDRVLQEAIAISTSGRRARTRLFTSARFLGDESFLQTIISKLADENRALKEVLTHRKRFKRLLVVGVKGDDKAVDEIHGKFDGLDFGARRKIEARLVEWVNSEYRAGFQPGELLMDLPKNKPSHRIPVVGEDGKEITRNPLFQKALDENYRVLARKLRIFAVRAPDGWNDQARSALRKEIEGMLRI
jgi:phosphohydrolase domain-containing protein